MKEDGYYQDIRWQVRKKGFSGVCTSGSRPGPGGGGSEAEILREWNGMVGEAMYMR